MRDTKFFFKLSGGFAPRAKKADVVAYMPEQIRETHRVNRRDQLDMDTICKLKKKTRYLIRRFRSKES